MPTITLIGYRGTGKSTVAMELARRIECAWWDADLELERDLGTTIGQLVRERGEGVFRDEEARILARLLAAAEGIVATGGGAILRPANRDLLRARGGLVVWLTAPVEVVRRRLSADPMTPIRRPGLSGADPLSEIETAISFREPLYRECAHVTVDTSAASPAVIAAEILSALEADGRASTEPS